ncbi:MAG: hypothetical protein J6568_05125 [Snodgrassella sp.]|nr:hypothetical protein [Snodgrassella sp.]
MSPASGGLFWLFFFELLTVAAKVGFFIALSPVFFDRKLSVWMSKKIKVHRINVIKPAAVKVAKAMNLRFLKKSRVMYRTLPVSSITKIKINSISQCDIDITFFLN